MPALRQHYVERLEEIRSETIRMGAMAGDMVRMAVDAAIVDDAELATSVLAMDDDVDRLEEAIRRKTMLMVMQEAPVANDFKSMMATLAIIAEIEKTGDDAVKLARRSARLAGSFPGELKNALMEMGKNARQQYANSLKLYDHYTTEAAKEIVDGDVEIDNAFKAARERIVTMIQQNPAQADILLRCASVFHALEHVADHAVEIARRMQGHFNQPI